MMFDVFSFTSPRSRLSWRSSGNVHRSWFERPGNQEPRDFARAGIAAWPILIHSGSCVFQLVCQFVICFSFILAVQACIFKKEWHYCAANGGEALGTAALFHRDQIALFSVELWPIKVVSPESNGTEHSLKWTKWSERSEGIFPEVSQSSNHPPSKRAKTQGERSFQSW